MPLSNELSLLPLQSLQSDPVRSLDLTAFDLRLDRFRLVQPKAEQLRRRSLAKYGQLAPVVFCQLEETVATTVERPPRLTIPPPHLAYCAR